MRYMVANEGGIYMCVLATYIKFAEWSDYNNDGAMPGQYLLFQN